MTATTRKTETTAARRAPQFDLVGGHPCLDFVNTLDDRFSDHPKELLASYRDLARFAEDTRLLSTHQVDRLCARSQQSPQAAQHALHAAIALREAMSEVFYALARERPVPKASLAILNRYVQQAAQHARLAPANGHFEWQFDPAQDHLDSPLWPLARQAAELLASDRLQYVRACASPTCEWLFLDESKNHRRRWCDMTKCGNRAKVQSFYNRQKKS
jgi:predicted RNA-binding Zn ribbon-like protein